MFLAGVLRPAVEAVQDPFHALDLHLDPRAELDERRAEFSPVEVDQRPELHLEAAEFHLGRPLRAQAVDQLRGDALDLSHATAVIAPTVSDSLGPGQRAIRLRDALMEGDITWALHWAEGLDEAHVYEVIAGACIRDGRDHFAAARAFPGALARGDWQPVLERLLGEPDTAFDDEAASLVAARIVPDRWRPGGTALTVPVLGMEHAATLYAAGAAGLALVDALRSRQIYETVSLYYRRGTLHALGPRPMLVLSASG